MSYDLTPESVDSGKQPAWPAKGIAMAKNSYRHDVSWPRDIAQDAKNLARAKAQGWVDVELEDRS